MKTNNRNPESVNANSLLTMSRNTKKAEIENKKTQEKQKAHELNQKRNESIIARYEEVKKVLLDPNFAETLKTQAAQNMTYYTLTSGGEEQYYKGFTRSNDKAYNPRDEEYLNEVLTKLKEDVELAQVIPEGARLKVTSYYIDDYSDRTYYYKFARANHDTYNPQAVTVLQLDWKPQRKCTIV